MSGRLRHPCKCQHKGSLPQHGQGLPGTIRLMAVTITPRVSAFRSPFRSCSASHCPAPLFPCR